MGVPEKTYHELVVALCRLERKKAAFEKEAKEVEAAIFYLCKKIECSEFPSHALIHDAFRMRCGRYDEVTP